MTSQIRFVHNIYNYPKVNIILGDFEIAKGLAYKRSSPYLQVSSGNYVLKLMSGNKIIYENEIDLKKGTNYTAIIHGKKSIPQLLLLVDDLGCISEDRANVRVVHAAFELGLVDIYYNNNLMYENLVYEDVGKPEYYSFPIGLADFTVVKPGTIRNIAGPYSLDLEKGSIYTMIVSGSSSKSGLIISEDSNKICITI